MTLGNGMFLRMKDHKIQRSNVPMNDIYWTYYESLADKAINMDNFKNVEYEDINMLRTKPFKRRD